MAVICQLHKAGWQLSVSYMRQDSSFLQEVCVLSLCLETGWWFSVSYMRQVGSCLQEVCALCQLLKTDWLLTARNMCTLSVT